MMKIARAAVIFLLVLSSFAAAAAGPTKTELETMYDKAFREFDASHYDAALTALDAIDARQPDLAESQNLRGVVLMRKGEYNKAEAALRKALKIEPNFWNASFNLSEVPFLKKDWAEARNRFEALVAGKSDEMKGETRLLIQYKILLTFVLQGKENTVDWMVNKFEAEKESPALYYSNAAIALHRNNQKEAKEWMDAAEKHYPASLNKLFAESFYEVGWLTKPAGDSRAAIEVNSNSDRDARMKADAQANFERAERSFQQRDFPAARKFLDLADAGAPNQAASLNLRGEIFMEEKKFDEAEQVFTQAVAADPKFREAQYNLAQIPFEKKDYGKSRERLEALFGATPGGEKNQAAQLIKYKIFMTLLLEGNDTQAQKMMDQFKFTGDTPALYYAQAAWGFKHDNPDQGNDWIKSARKIYSPALNIIFADTFYDLGWLKRAPDTAPPTAALAQADAGQEAGPTPTMRFGEAESVLPPSATGDEEANVALATLDASLNASPVAVTPAPLASATPAVAVSSPVAVPAASATPAVVAQASPLATANPLPAQAVAKKGNVPAPKASAPAIVAASSAITPAPTALAPARIPERSQPRFAEMMGRATDPQTLLFGGLLLGGLVILGWVIVQQMRRQLPGASLDGAAVPLTESPSDGSDPSVGDERRISAEHLEVGPPKLSFRLEGCESAARPAMQPASALEGGNIASDFKQQAAILPNEPPASVSEVTPPVASPDSPAEKNPQTREPPALPNESKTPLAPLKASLRDEKEVSLAAAPQPFLPSAPPGNIAEPKAAVTEPKELAAGVEHTTAAGPPGHREEPVGQGQPISRLTPIAPTPPIAFELTALKTEPEAKPDQAPVRLEREPVAIRAIAGAQAAPQASVETSSFNSKITNKPTKPPSTTLVIMPESSITPISPDVRTSKPTVAVQQPAGSMPTAVQLTFSLEIVSMQLTPAFGMHGLQLKPTSKVVSMRLAPSQQPQPPMNLQVTFELANIQLSDGAIGTIRLAPTAQEKPAVLSSPSFAVSGLELIASAGSAPLQLTPSHQEQASVHLTAEFQITAVEFSPLFEITAIVLNSTSKKVSMQLPVSGPSSIDSAPVFEIENVQLGGNSELGIIQVAPMGASARLTTPR